MAFHLYEDVWETSTTTGTGAYTLAGAVAGYREFSSQYADGDTCWYSAYDGVNFESGIGTYNASGDTLSRTTIYRSTNGGSAINWTGGTIQIQVVPLGLPLEQLLTPGSAGVPNRTADNSWFYPQAVTPSALSASANDYNPSGLATAGVLILTSSAAVNITGLAAQASNFLIELRNVGSFAITLKANSSASLTANRFLMSADVVLQPTQSVTFKYGATLGGWVLQASTLPGVPWTQISLTNINQLTGGTGVAHSGDNISEFVNNSGYITSPGTGYGNLYTYAVITWGPTSGSPYSTGSSYAGSTFGLPGTWECMGSAVTSAVCTQVNGFSLFQRIA